VTRFTKIFVKSGWYFQCAIGVIALTIAPAQAQVFGQGSLIVSAYGNVGTPATNQSYLDGDPTPISLLEFSTSGAINAAPISIFTLPTANNGPNLGVVGEYGSSSEGALQLSGNGHYLTIAGYSAIPSLAGVGAGGNGKYEDPSVTPKDTALAQSTSANVPRMAVLIDPNGNVISTTSFNDLFSTDNPRSVFTPDGRTIYISGEGSSTSNQGIYFASVGATNTSETIYDKYESRVAFAYEGNLYYSQDKKNDSTGIFEFTGVPTSTASAKQIIPSGGSGGVNYSPDGFYFANGTTLYVADTGVPKSGGTGDGGIQKWIYNGSAWKLAYTLKVANFVSPSDATSATHGETGFEAVTGQVTGSGSDAVVQLYAVSYTAGDADPDGLYAISDNVSATTESGETFTEIESSANLGPYVVFKGVAFPPTTLSFGDWANTEFSAEELANPNISGAAAAPNNDGVPNLLKYLYDIDPTADLIGTNRQSLPIFKTTTIGGVSYLTLTYRQAAFVSGISVKVQTSSDMQTWTTVDPPDVVEPLGTDSTTGDPILELGVRSNGQAKQFVRLQVTTP